MNIFPPKKSKGGISSLILFGLLMSLTVPILIMFIIVFNNIIFVILFSIFTVFMGCLVAYISYQFYSLKYILTKNELTIKCGIRTQKISYKSIEKIGKSPKKHLDGIRVFGTAIPGFLQGKFRILLEGSYENISLYATKLENLIFILTNYGTKLKYYGITPENPEEFIYSIKHKNEDINLIEVDTTKKLQSSPEEMHKYIKYTQILFIVSIALIVAIIFYSLIMYGKLPSIIPLHFDINLIPDWWGPKPLLLLGLILLLGIGISLTILLYHWTMSRSELAKSPDGYKIMLLPLIINLTFLLIDILIFSLIFQNPTFP